MPAHFSTRRMHRVARSTTLELLRADDDNEDLTDVLVRSIESLPYHFCAGCLSRGFKTRIAKRSRCLVCFRASKNAPRAA
jgi:hypothetical protein